MEVSGQISVVKRPVQSKPGVVKSGKVEGETVDDIFLDTGCSRTLVHRKLVPKEKAQDGGGVAIRCAHGDTVLYPLAKISLEVDGKSIVVEAAVSETLPMSVFLGTDIPELTELLQTQTTEQAFVAVTRAASVKKRIEEEDYRRKEENCGVQPKALEASGSTDEEDKMTDDEDWMTKFDDEEDKMTDDEDWMTKFDESIGICGETRETKKDTKREEARNKTENCITDRS